MWIVEVRAAAKAENETFACKHFNDHRVGIEEGRRRQSSQIAFSDREPPSDLCELSAPGTLAANGLAGSRLKRTYTRP